MRIEGVLFWVFPHRGECEFREKNILGKSCTTFVIVKIVRNLSRGRSPCQRVNHIKSGVIYFSAFIFSYDNIHVSGTIHMWNRGLTIIKVFLSKIIPKIEVGLNFGNLVFKILLIKSAILKWTSI